MTTIWALVEAAFADATRAERLVQTPAARRGRARLDGFLTRSSANDALSAKLGATPAMPLMDGLFLDLLPLTRAVHVRSEARVHDKHDQPRHR